MLSRGIVGDLKGELVVASPLYKQHFSLITGRCIEDVALSVPTYLTRLVDGQVWVQTQAHEQRRGGARRAWWSSATAWRRRARWRSCWRWRRRPSASPCSAAETQGGYNRVLLSPLLSGEKKLADVITHPPEWYAERGITLHLGDTITRIDRARRVVHSQRGISAAYDRLLIATGSRPVILPVPGAELAGVKTFRDLLDVDALLAAARAAGRNAVVIGGGLLGLEAASGLQRQGMQVTRGPPRRDAS